MQIAWLGYRAAGPAESRAPARMCMTADMSGRCRCARRGLVVPSESGGPGFAMDDRPRHLAETLFVPSGGEACTADPRLILPQFALPLGARVSMHDLHVIRAVITVLFAPMFR